MRPLVSSSNRSDAQHTPRSPRAFTSHSQCALSQSCGRSHGPTTQMSALCATASALMAAACTAIVIRAASKEQGAKDKRLHLLGTLACILLVIMFVLLTVVSARGHRDREDDPESALRIILAIVQFCGAIVMAAAAARWSNTDGSQQGEAYNETIGDATAIATAVAGSSDCEDPTSRSLHPSTLSASVSRAPASDAPLDDKCSAAALMREKLRVESKLRDARRMLDELTRTLNILHYCTPTTPRRPFALTSMPRGHSLLASLPASDFEPMLSEVSRLNQEALARCSKQRPASPHPLPVVWQQLRDVERLLLHPVAVELFKAFLAQQTTHAAFPAVEPVAAAMLILDAKRLHQSDPASLAKLVAHLLSCYLSHCDESPAPPCSLPLSASLHSRFADAVRQWKLASAPGAAASVGSSELLATVVSLFGFAAVECTHWLALLYLPAFQHNPANKLAQFCVGYSQSLENADRSASPPTHSQQQRHHRQHSDPKTSARSASSTNPSPPRPPVHTRRPVGDVSPSASASRQRIHLHLSPTPPRSLQRSSSMEPASPSVKQPTFTYSVELPARLDAHFAGMFKPVTPPSEAQSALLLSALSASSTPPSNSSSLFTWPITQQQQQLQQQQMQGPSSPGVEHAATAAAAGASQSSSSAPSSSVGSRSASPPSVPVSPSGAFSTFRLPNTMSHSPAVSLRKAVLIAAQEIVTPSFQNRRLTAEGNPMAMTLSPPSTSPVTVVAVAPFSPSPPSAAPALCAATVVAADALPLSQPPQPAGDWQV